MCYLNISWFCSEHQSTEWKWWCISSLDFCVIHTGKKNSLQQETGPSGSFAHFTRNPNLIFKGNLILGVVPLNALSACAETPPQAPSILPLWACPCLTAVYIIQTNVLETAYLSNIDFSLNFVRGKKQQRRWRVLSSAGCRGNNQEGFLLRCWETTERGIKAG